jgi:hypothetical protein
MHGTARAEAIGAASVRPDPQRALPVPENTPHRNSGDGSEGIGSGAIMVDRIDARRNGPDRSVAIRGNGFEVRIGATGERNHPHQGSTEPHQAILRAYPNLVGMVFIDAQYRVAGQQPFPVYLLELAVHESEEAMADGSNPEGAVVGLLERAYRADDTSDGFEALAGEPLKAADRSYPDGAIAGLKNSLDPVLAIRSA